MGTGASVTIETLAETVMAVAGTSSEIVPTEPRRGDINRSRPTSAWIGTDSGSTSAGIESLLSDR